LPALATVTSQGSLLPKQIRSCAAAVCDPAAPPFEHPWLAILVAAIPPLMLKTGDNPEG